MIRFRPWAWVIALALVATGCGPGESGESGTEATMTEDEAAEKVREHIDNTMTALPEEAELEERRGTIVAACDDPTDGGSRDRVTVSETFWVRGLPVEDNDATFELLHEHWSSNGYQVFEDLRPEDMFLSVEHAEDAFGMTVQVAGDGSLALSASSPCVQPEGAPDS
ncbi:hypothetical protein [Nocardiopsis dassonvillei]|uniref:hypothetical protein n=1 Tax=Nocardiopsis dassonvillei TaxID=2014 RepID=UPI001EE2B150|nr:hypothetical protein [Nocardiopsis dassonvillei]